MERPTQITNLSGDDFAAYYWLKAELVTFCRANKLATSGSKQQLTERIQHFLDTGERLRAKPKPRTGRMPTTFTRETLIGENWRCSQALRAFFESEIGSTFHFNQFMRDFVQQDGVGQTLQAAIDGWKQSKQRPKSDNIDPQFEYNRHFRDYFAQNEGATREDAIRAWHEKKAQRKATGDNR